MENKEIKNIKGEILDKVKDSEREAVKGLLNKLEGLTIENYIKSKFKGRAKSYHIDKDSTKTLEEYINKSLSRKEATESLKISEVTFFRMLREYKEAQKGEYKQCGTCKELKPISEYQRNGKTPEGKQKYGKDCRECRGKQCKENQEKTK